MREGGRHLARILDKLAGMVQPGASGKDIAQVAAKEVKAAGLQPILLGHEGFPDVICISVNQAIVHGVPTAKAFRQGDVVKLDLTVAHKALVVDSAVTAMAGQDPNADKKRLIESTRRALYAGIDAVSGEGTRVGDISAAVEDVLNKNKLGVIRDLVGHAVGHEIWEKPNIPNYGIRGTGPALISGMTIAIEPMASLGDWPVDILDDGWTVTMRDGSLSAHFEHTVLITDKDAEILTLL